MSNWNKVLDRLRRINEAAAGAEEEILEHPAPVDPTIVMAGQVLDLCEIKVMAHLSVTVDPAKVVPALREGLPDMTDEAALNWFMGELSRQTAGLPVNMRVLKSS